MARPIPRRLERTDADPDAPVVQRAVITIGGQVAAPEDEDDEDLKPLPDRLVTELTAERTLALRDKLANTPAVAFQAVLHKFCLDVFSRYFSYGTAMEVSVRSASFPVQAQGLKDTPAAKAIDARHRPGKSGCPRTRPISGTGLRPSPATSRRRSSPIAPPSASMRSTRRATATARASRPTPSSSASPRPIAWPRPSISTWCRPAGVRPSRTISAGCPSAASSRRCRKAQGERAAQLIDHLKKGDMAKEAERLLADTGWLPEPLRIAAVDDAPVEATEADDDGEALPEFLAGDDEEAEADDAAA